MLNIDELAERLKSISRDDENAYLSLIVNLQELQQDEQYVDSTLETNDEDDVLSTIEFDDVDSITDTFIEAATFFSTATSTFALSVRFVFFSRRHFVADISKSIEHERIRTSTLNIFDVALELRCEEIDISRS